MRGFEFASNLESLYDDDTNVVALSTDLAQKSHNSQNTHRRLAFTKDRLFMYSPLILFQKKSILTQEFNHQLQLLQESGLIDYWTRDYTDSHKSSSKQKVPKKLGMISVLAAFQICAVMYFISLIVFLLEIISVKYPRIKSVLDYLTY